MTRMKLRYALTCLFFVLPAFFWFLWSFILTDRSLLYSSSSIFLRFQNFWWQFADNRVLITALYIGVVALLFGIYAMVLKKTSQAKTINIKHFLVPLSIFFLFFILSNPALSYDLFNYLFDAKLVVHYHLDPHTASAILFAGKDDWVRFMRNTFFPTTYGYVWTALSLIPFVAGLGKFLTVFVAFKLFMALGLLLLFLIQRKFGAAPKALALFYFSPLVLLETLSSAHNDIWMMLLAFVSLALVLHFHPKTISRRIGMALISLLFLVASLEVKRSTLLLAPVWLAIVLEPYLPAKINAKVKNWWGDLCALLMFAPLFTELSRQFNPWYLVWPLSFLPFVKHRLIRIWLIAFSITSLARYVPILYVGIYSVPLENFQKIITWSALPIGLLWWGGLFIFSQKKRRLHRV